MKITDILTEKCWKGYEKKGMKTMFGKRVPNCVKKESLGEDLDGKYANWDHEESADYSKHLEKTFGEPDEATDEQTVWHNIDGFKRVVCRDEYILHGSPAPHYDFVYSYVDMEVPEEISDELAKCSGSILIDHLKNEVGARCGSLTANATTLNFVMDVIAGREEPSKENYEGRILAMKDMFSKGERYELDWWPDESGDADPKNPYYAENVEERLVKLDPKGPKNLKTLKKRSKYEKRKATLAQPDDINEGPNDPAIFKAVFTAGGPGAGKSYVVRNSGFEAMGFKIINSDIAFEKMLKQMKMDATPDNIYSPQGQETRDKAKDVTKKRQEMYTNTGRLGLVMDGTGKDYEKIVRMSEKLKRFGYETAMVFVNTDLETALARNEKRDRTLPAEQVKGMWSQVQNNIGKFQRYFKQDMIIIDNSDDSDIQSAITNAYNQIGSWSQQTPSNPIAQKWLSQQKEN